MKPLTPAIINGTRSLVVWVLRAVAVVLLGVGSYLVLKKLLFGVGAGPAGFEMMFRVYEGTGEAQSTYRGLALLLVGAALAVFARRLARWVVAMPETGCPRCGYAGAATDTCPECGLRGFR